METVDLLIFTEEILNGKLHFLCRVNDFLTGIYFVKVCNRNNEAISEICSKLARKTSK